MSKHLFLQVAFYLISIYSFGQSVYVYQGKVINDRGEALVGVQFKLLVADKVLGISDVEGKYYIETSEPSLRVAQMGFQDEIITYNDSVVVLLESSSLLNAVVITENKSSTELKNSTISLEIVQPDLIENTAPTNLEESVARINGVQVVDNQPTIRSGSGWSYGAGSRVQVLVDGVPMLSGDAGQPLWTFVPTEGLQGVEVIKGASSVIYGSSALNGVLNIKMKKPASEPYTRVASSAGFYDLASREGLRYQGKQRNTVSNLTAYHTGTYKGFGVNLGVNALNDEGYKMSDYDKRVRATVGLRKAVSKHNLIYGLNTTYQQGVSGSFLLWESLNLGYTALDSNSTDNKVSRVSVDPYLSWTNGKFTHKLNTRYLGIQNEVDNGDPTTDQSNRSNLFFAEYQAQLDLPTKKITAIGGIVSTRTVSRSPLFLGNQNARNYAAYLQITKRWGRLLATAGSRYEYFVLNEREEGKPVFRMGLNYRAAQYTFVRASYGEGYRFPSIAESYITTTVGPVSIYPNDNLEAETGTNIEIGVRQGLELKGIKMMADLSFFSMQFDNMMEFTFGQWGALAPPLFGVGFKTLNTGRAEVKGGELTLSFLKKSGDLHIQGFVGYTFSQSRALEPRKIVGTDNNRNQLTYINTSSDTTNYLLKYRPVHTAKTDVMVTYKKWSVGLGASFQSSVNNVDAAFVSIPINLFVTGVQESVEQGLTSYTLINTRIGYEFANYWKTNLIISNISNTEYAIRPADLGAPRSVRVQFTYTLDKK